MDESEATKGGEEEEGEEVDLGRVTVLVDKSNTSFSVGLPLPLPLSLPAFPLPSARESELEACLRFRLSSLKMEEEEAERGDVGDSLGVRGDGGP